MSDERWPYGTIVRRDHGDEPFIAMVVVDLDSLLLTTLKMPDWIAPSEFYKPGQVWEWSAYRNYWTRVEDV